MTLSQRIVELTQAVGADIKALLTDKQDADNTLTALANLATSADKMIYATGADQFALTPLTAFIRSLLDDADAASARATLGAAADNHGHATSQITGLDGALGDRYTKAEANNLLAAKINKAGDTMTGQLTFKGGTLEAGGGFNSAADNDSGMDFPADGHVRLRSNARVAVEALPDGTVKTWYGGNYIACQPDGNMVVYDTHGAAKHVFRGNGSYTATDNIESQANIYGREVIAKQTAIICNRNNESQQWHIYSDNDRDLKFYSTVAGDTVGYINREGKIYTTGYGWLHDKFTPLASPALTGIPTAPTAATGTRSTQLATTAFVGAEIAADRPFEATAANIKMDGTQSVGTLNTVARADHVHPTDTSRAPLASPALTGTPTAPTAAYGTNNTQIANTAFVQKELNSRRYVSGELTISPLATVVAQHPLGAEPMHVSCFLRCVSADGGYAVGDLILAEYGNDMAAECDGLSVIVNANTITVKCAVSSPFFGTRKDNGLEFQANYACWKLIIKASL